MPNRLSLLSALLLTLPSLAAAQTPKTFSACYVPAVGAMYLIKTTGLPNACLSSSHVEITWSESVLADGGVTTAKLADGSVTAAKLSADVNNAIVADGSITTAKLADGGITTNKLADGSVTAAKLGAGAVSITHLSFDPATQTELDAHTHAALGNGNTRVGAGALAVSSAQDNTALGFIALAANTSGVDNVAVGSNALLANTTGHFNTAVGTAAMADNQTGLNNTAMGSAALLSNTSGNNNTAMGAGALLENPTGVANTGIGFRALRNLASGGNNTALGRTAGLALASGDNNVYIANDGEITESNTIRIGSTQTKSFLAGVSGVGVTGVAVMVDASGQLGITSSSRRYKQDIATMGDASARLMQLRPVVFRYRQRGDSALQYGLIAEEVAEVFPELVARDKTGEIETVRYHVLASLLLNELQRQQREIAALRDAIGTLTAKAP
jgi:hypothetical protein